MTSGTGKNGFLTAESLRRGLKTFNFGKILFCFEKLSSTNDLALELAQGGAEEGTLIVSETQTKGRGRQGRRWISAPGKSITFSIVLRPNLLADEMPEITLASAVAVAWTLEKWKFKPAIKWPNDIQISGQKVCGILTEMGSKKDKMGLTAVLGIGVNLNQKPSDFPDEFRRTAASLFSLSGKNISRVRFFQDLLLRLEETYGWVKERRFSKVLAEWRKRASTLGKQVRITQSHRNFYGHVLDVDEKGALLVRNDLGMLERVISGDVEILTLRKK